MDTRATYQFRDSYLDRLVVVKFYMHPGDISRIESEASRTSQILSKHVVQVYDCIASHSKKHCAIVMEHIDGTPLRMCQASEVHLLLLQLALGLSDVHHSGSVHRDVKPDNVLVDKEGVVKLVDFEFLTRSQDATMRNRRSQDYAAPELLDGSPTSVTPALDMYSFGVLAKEVAYNAFRSSTEQPVEPSQIIGRPYADIDESAPGFLAQLIDDCVRVDPQGRPKAKEVASALNLTLTRGGHRCQLILNGEPLVIGSTTSAQRVSSGTKYQMLVTYDGFFFHLTPERGAFYINNVPVRESTVLPSSCVVTFGESHLGRERLFVPLNMAHPHRLP